MRRRARPHSGRRARCGPRLRLTIRAMFGGLGAPVAAASATNSSSSWSWSAWLKRRSKPIVDDAFELMPFPQSEPATWPGKTSTPSGSSSSRRSEWKSPSAPSFAPTARSGRAASPTKSESPVRTSHGSSARERSATARQVCSGRWPGVWMARRTTRPTSSSRPSASASAAYSTSAAGWIETATPWSSASRPCPERWSAWVCVSIVRTISTPRRSAVFEQLLDRVRGVDHYRDAGVLVADQVRHAPEVVVHELLEEHEW